MNIQRDEIRRFIAKYNISGPRYTSYPTAPQFQPLTNRGEFATDLEAGRALKPAKYSLYFHLPFCRALCWYCGCTKVITRRQESGDEYLDYLEKEIGLISNKLHPNSAVKQIHFGGGTPTFFTPGQLSRLGKIINTAFTQDEDTEFSVEIDPRECTAAHISVLKNMGCNRASLGVQDTNPDVQKAIHRVQPFEMTKKITEELRKQGIKRINFDLIYGLPKQTPQTFQTTLEQVSTLSPDRLAIYNYAHIPSLIPSQKLLHVEDFPEPGEKIEMLLSAMDFLAKHEYEFIGMDHFARKDDELSKALYAGTLQRNFQGYSTHAELEMIAFGMSAISQSGDLYYQNAKDLNEYYSLLDNELLPIIKILRLTGEDIIRKKIIMQIMCSGKVSYHEFEQLAGISFAETYSGELRRLAEFEQDGLLSLLPSGFQVTEKGRLFVRNIAMVFDEYLKKPAQKVSYSKTV